MSPGHLNACRRCSVLSQGVGGLFVVMIYKLFRNFGFAEVTYAQKSPNKFGISFDFS